jgi:hypothetical protein
MFIIGLGNGGIRIAEEFQSYPQYEVFKIGTDLQKDEKSWQLSKYKTPEQYEENCPDLSKFFKPIEDEVLFITVGGSNITGVSLAILQQLKSCQINVLYIRPDLGLLSQKKQLQERITFNVFQEYARSALFNKLYIVDNVVMEKVIGDTTISMYHKKLNSLIASTMHMINVCKNSDPVILTDQEESAITRISTIGLSEPTTGKETLFYNLSNITNKFYYFSISKTVLEKDEKLLAKIKNQVKEKLVDSLNGGFGVYENEWKQNYIYIEASTHIIQNNASDT